LLPFTADDAKAELAMPNPPDTLTIEEHFFADDGRVPNNSSLPLIVYRSALATGPRCVADCEKLFADNGWSGGWRNGIYAHHHYHGTAHEVLGIAAGSVRVRLGGEDGTTVELHAGDVVVIPAGVAHKNECASPDLVVVGAYPGGKSPDMCTPTAQGRERALRHVREVPLPASDPVYGKPGPLIKRWSAAKRG
jgi:uncharacterized protein YjlB